MGAPGDVSPAPSPGSPPGPRGRDIPSSDLAVLRGILVSSLSRENLAVSDLHPTRPRHRVTFRDPPDCDDPLSPGATPDDQKSSRPSSTKQNNQGLHWFGHGALDIHGESAGPHSDEHGASNKDREDRIRALKEKQNEDRQRKLDELKQQAITAQKLREQKEEERKKRLEEVRARDSDRRAQVEERKRQIWEAERDRREAILRKNQEREARIEAKRKNERSSIVFAFGSSTPRMLEPGETSSYWATRRATSTTNVMSLSMSAAVPLTRRSSERELDATGKKRATSAGGFDRKSPLDDTDGCGPSSTRRKKTDLTPTVPSPRDSVTTLSGSRSFSKSKASPGRAVSMSRLDILAQPRRRADAIAQDTVSQSGRPSRDMSRSMSNLAPSGGSSMVPRAKLASRSMLTLVPRLNRAEMLRLKARDRQPTLQDPPSPGMRSGEATPSRPVSSMSQASVASNLSQVSTNLRSRPPGTPRRPRPISIAVTGVTSPASAEKINIKSNPSSVEKPPIAKVHSTTKKPASAPSPKPEVPKKPTEKPAKPIIKPNISGAKVNGSCEITSSEDPGGAPVDLLLSGEVSPATVALMSSSVLSEPIPEEPRSLDPISLDPVLDMTPPMQASVVVSTPTPAPATPTPAPSAPATEQTPAEDRDSEMNTSMTSKTRITTEEEAKAALAERRRLAREQAEREAELERQRLEAERLAEEERLRKEEEEQRRMEEEQLKLLEEAKKAEELRLEQAIEEAKKREEEEKKRREEEARLKLEKEEAERKAKEEAEKQRKDMEEKLKKEEEDRQARRKRVEAIMLRTRGKGSTAASTPTKEGEENGSPPGEEKEDKMTSSMASESGKFLDSERSHSNGSPSDVADVSSPQIAAEVSSPQLAAVLNSTDLLNNKHNGHHNGSIHSVEEINVTNSLLDLEPVGQILDLPSGNGKITDPPQIQFLGFPEKNEPPTVNDMLS